MPRFQRIRPGMTLSAGPNKGSVSFVGNGQGGAVPVVANASDISNFSVINWNQLEVLTQSLYDSQAYAAAGQSQLQFFNVPQGAGTSWTGTGTKNLSDTNLTLQNQLSAGQMFIVTSIEVQFLPNTPSTAAFDPATATAFATNVTTVNDSWYFYRSGNIVFKVLSKNYLEEAPIGRCPPLTDFDVSAAVASDATEQLISYATFAGSPYQLTPNNILITPNTNFNVTLGWPEGVQALPSDHAARVFARLNGLLFRQAQ